MSHKNYSVYINNRNKILEDENEAYNNHNNKISTSIYTWYNCIPKILIQQFSKYANIYFLVIMFMQCIKEISITGGRPTMLPGLIVVITISGIKDFIEDRKRKISDNEENEKKCLYFNYQNKTFEEKKWEDVKLGEILKIKKNEEFPADLVLLCSSNSSGNCYIETKNLDGETNLKIKTCENILSKFTENENNILEFSGILNTNLPNENIFEFNANIKLNTNHHSYSDLNGINENGSFRNYKDEICIKNSSFLLRGCSLKLTEFIIGLVVYVGNETKIMKNSPKLKSKISRVEDTMNLQILTVFLFQLILSSIGAFIYITMKHDNIDILRNYIFPDFNFSYNNFLISFVLNLATWILIFTNFVPISLLVTLEMIKYIQAKFISWDVELICPKTFNPSFVQTSTLNDELGQIQFVFSDKTGTLTKNKMKFHNISVGDKIYGNNDVFCQNYSDKYGEITNIHFQDENLKKQIYNKSSPNLREIDLFLKCLCLCNTVIAEKDTEGNIKYHASSIDEKALLNGARYLDYIFFGKNKDGIFEVEINGEIQQFELLDEIDFDSQRKRMSVIVKDLKTNKIIMFTKGADSAIRKLISQNKEYLIKNEEQLFELSSKGLRNLNIAYKYLEEKEYKEWSVLYKKARSPENINLNLDEVISKIENDFFLLGIASIEDELQDDVEETLNSLIRNNIKVWMLTGDQKITAKSIAKSCKMITQEFDLTEFDENGNQVAIKKKLEEINRKIFFKNNKLSILIGTDDISAILKNEELKTMFYLASINVDSVIFFRATPKQKAEMVHLIKSYSSDVSTLAIGDGANDVNMIASAHVGIGIFGEEGKQAARASDYCITQFSFLKRLLLFHGREFYRKNTYVICYNFYKNCFFVVPQFWYGIYSLFSGQTMYDGLIYQFYNFLFTSFPIIWFGIYDMEFTPGVLLNSDKHYTQGIIGKLFHGKRFWKWVLTGIFQGLLLILLHCFSFGNIEANGFTQNMWSIGSAVYSSVVLIVNLRLFFSTNRHDINSFLLIFGSIFMYYLVLFIMNFITIFQNFNNFIMIFSSLNFYLSTILVCFLAYAFDNGVGKLLVLFGLVKDPLRLKKNEIYIKSKIDLGNDKFKYLDMKEIDSGYSYQKVDIKENLKNC